MSEILKYFLRRLSGYYINLKAAKRKIILMLSEEGSSLDRLGFIEGTDKASVMEFGNLSNYRITHDYLRHYDFVFGSHRAKKFSLFEFGCADGASLRMWEKYFPEAEIYGVDLDDTAKRHETEHIHVVIGDATSSETCENLKSLAGNAFIIIDDASHAWGDQRRSLELFWNVLTPGGFYAVEDLQCGSLGAYPAYPPKVLDAQPFSEYMLDRCKFLQCPLDDKPEGKSYHLGNLPEQIQKIEREMDMCMFIPGAVIIRKKA